MTELARLQLALWQRRIVVGATLAVAGLAWIALARGTGAGEPGAGPEPAALLVVATWLLMCVAMMLPTALPWLAVMAATSSERATRRLVVGALTTTFAAGYLTVWAAFAIGAATAQIALRRLLAATSVTAGGGLLALLLLFAGAYQLSGAKRACLRHCRNPLGYFLRRWRDGANGALRMGAEHGLRCLGCCWALMLLMLGAGTMSLAWMAALTALTAVEQAAPAGPRIARLVGGGFLFAGAMLLV